MPVWGVVPLLLPTWRAGRGGASGCSKVTRVTKAGPGRGGATDSYTWTRGGQSAQESLKPF